MNNQDQQQSQGTIQQGQQQNQQQNQQQGSTHQTQSGARQIAPTQLGQGVSRQASKTPAQVPSQAPNERRQIGDEPPQNEQGDPRQLQLENESARQPGSDLSNGQRQPTQQGGVTSDQDDSANGSASDQL